MSTKRNISLIIFIIVIFSFLLLTPNLTDAPATLGQSSILGTHLLKNTSRNLALNEPVPVPEKFTHAPDPILEAKQAVVIERKSYTPLFQKEANTQTKPASTTKIATAIVAYQNFDLNDRVIVPADLYDHVDGSLVGLVPSDQLTVEDLIWGMLVNSGNDAAYSLASHDPNGIDGFVGKMNTLTKTLNLKNTHFENPIGYDHPNHYSTPHDLAIMTDYALKIPLFRQIVAQQNHTIYSVINPHQTYFLKTTNQLLGQIEGVNGVKTGWTSGAQGVLITHVEREGKEIITVVMQSPAREEDTRRLIDWVYANFNW